MQMTAGAHLFLFFPLGWLVERDRLVHVEDKVSNAHVI